jgi:hypothetical protein
MIKAIFHCSRFARAGVKRPILITHVKNQSRGHAKKVDYIVQLSWRVREHSGGQKIHRLDN